MDNIDLSITVQFSAGKSSVLKLNPVHQPMTKALIKGDGLPQQGSVFHRNTQTAHQLQEHNKEHTVLTRPPDATDPIQTFPQSCCYQYVEFGNISKLYFTNNNVVVKIKSASKVLGYVTIETLIPQAEKGTWLL